MSASAPVLVAQVSGAKSRGHAFGIEIQSSLGLPLSRRTEAPGGRRAMLELVSAQALEGEWRPRAARTALERRFADGRLAMSVEHDPELGYRVYAPRNGRHLVATDGTRIVSAVPRVSQWRWQRLLFAQVLPLAATLQGVELLHASSVALSGRALGLVAPAGTGKTSVAAHLVAAGAGLLTDDVLALERSTGGIMAHPGVATLSIDPAELTRMPEEGRRRLGKPLGRTDKTVLAAQVSDRPIRLGALYFLERPAPDGIRIERLDPDPVRLLANTFNTYVRSPVRMVNQLDLMGELAESVAMFSVAIPSGSLASDVARAVAEHAGGHS